MSGYGLPDTSKSNVSLHSSQLPSGTTLPGYKGVRSFSRGLIYSKDEMLEIRENASDLISPFDLTCHDQIGTLRAVVPANREPVSDLEREVSFCYISVYAMLFYCVCIYVVLTNFFYWCFLPQILNSGNIHPEPPKKPIMNDSSTRNSRFSQGSKGNEFVFIEILWES
jgi:hypothetical protein